MILRLMNLLSIPLCPILLDSSRKGFPLWLQTVTFVRKNCSAYPPLHVMAVDGTDIYFVLPDQYTIFPLKLRKRTAFYVIHALRQCWLSRNLLLLPGFRDKTQGKPFSGNNYLPCGSPHGVRSLWCPEYECTKLS